MDAKTKFRFHNSNAIEEIVDADSYFSSNDYNESELCLVRAIDCLKTALDIIRHDVKGHKKHE